MLGFQRGVRMIWGARITVERGTKGMLFYTVVDELPNYEKLLFAYLNVILCTTELEDRIPRGVVGPELRSL